MPAIEWVNFNVFVAHLKASGAMGGKSATYAIWEMRDAFEAPPEDPELQDYRVMAAAQWIFWYDYGQNLFNTMRNPCILCEPLSRIWSVGPFLKEGRVAPLSLERLRFWRTGFAAAAENVDASEEYKTLASKASLLMESMENSMVF